MGEEDYHHGHFHLIHLIIIKLTLDVVVVDVLCHNNKKKDGVDNHLQVHDAMLIPLANQETSDIAHVHQKPYKMEVEVDGVVA